MPKSRTDLTEAEWAIIKAVWDAEPCTAPDIREKLHRQTSWTYSTVRTLMDRMVVKGLLAAEKVRNLTIYRSAVTREQAQRRIVLRPQTRLQRGPNPDGPVPLGHRQLVSG